MSKKIETYDFVVRIAGINVISPLTLMNAKDIVMSHYYFFILWTNKCQKLSLFRLKVNKKWCNYVIDNCDCTGIETLILDGIKFAYDWKHDKKLESDNGKSLKSLKLLNDFTNKFQNLKKLTINYRKFDVYVLLLWKYLLTIILKNNGQIIVDGLA